MISQDTSAYGVDIKYAAEPLERPRGPGEISRSRPRARRVRRLGAAALRLPLPACRRCHCADGRRQSSALSRRAVPARQSRLCSNACGGRRRRKRRWSASVPGATICPSLTIRSTFIVGFPGRDRRRFRPPARLARRGAARSRRLLPLRAGRRRRGQRSRRRGARYASKRSAIIASWRTSRRFRKSASSAKSATASASSSTRSTPNRGAAGSIPRKAAVKGDAPQIDGAVHVASRRPLRVGEIATVKIERADAYDLHGAAVGY